MLYIYLEPVPDILTASERVCPLGVELAETCIALGEVDPHTMPILHMGAVLEDQGLNPGESQGTLPLCGGGLMLMAARHIQLHSVAGRLEVSFAI